VRSRHCGRASILKACLLALAGLLASAVPASAGTAIDRPLLFSFDGSGAAAGAFSGVRALDIDQSNGFVYVIDEGNGVVDKFNLAGEAQDFAATGSSSLGTGLSFNRFSNVAVDNSSANPGQIDVTAEFGPVKAFSPSGSPLWDLSGFGDNCGLAVDAEGHPWVADFEAVSAREYANSGSPPAEIGATPVTDGFPCRLDLDALGNLYVNRYEAGVDKYEGGVKVATIDSDVSEGVTVDQSSASGHVFSEYDSSGSLVGSYGGTAIDSGQGIAYDKALDRVYVSDGASGTVRVFGHVIVTVPDVTIAGTSEVGISKARFNGTVNPQSVPNIYFFQWKQGQGPDWSGAESSPPHSLPEDSSDHPVSFDATGLSGNTPYQARLVGENTETDTKIVSGVDTFTTAQATTAPAVSIEPPSGTTAEGAQIEGTINPQGDAGTTWHLQISTDPACASGFSDGPAHDVSSEASSPVSVSEELTGLTTVQRYCVRIVADNSAGTTTSDTVEFETEALPLSEAETAFAAPRTDTSARLNGRIDPRGTPTTYHFDYSEDGGASWISLPNLHDTSRATKQIVLSQELTGLSPATTYDYRFVVENGAGPSSPASEEKAFSTRATAEVAEPSSCPNEDIRTLQRSAYLGDCRALELVNSPDKGNQHVLTKQPELGTPPLSPNGEEAIWSVFGGAPGGTTGTGATFLARRTGSGWQSRSLVPPASGQVGGGKFQYTLPAATPDFSKFVFVAGTSVFGSTGTPTVLRLGRDQQQEVLRSYPGSMPSAPGVGLSDDGTHVLIINPDTMQLEDIGSDTPELISVMPDGTPSACGLVTGLSFSGPEVVAAGTNWRPAYQRAATTDTSRVYFEAKPNGECSKSYGLYQRNRETGITTLIDPGGNGSFGEDSYLIRATPDGRSVYFVTKSKLDTADTNSHHDVYRWDEGSGDATCLSCVVADANLLFTGVAPQAVMVSDDFSHIYFRSESQLIPGKGVAGEKNLYVLSEGTIRFVTVLDDSDDLFALGTFAQSSINAILSPDGNVLLFRARPSRALTSDEVALECANSEGIGAPVQPCKQLYRYDDRDGSIECVSCLRAGLTTEAVGSEAFSLKFPAFNMSSDGDTIAFVAATPLLRRDVNQAADIYEWRNGVLHLLTDGVSTFSNSNFGAPAVRSVGGGGRDILISLVDPGRTGFERDGLANLYDARIDGGFAPPSSVAHCSEESCQGPLQPAPIPKRAASGAIGGVKNRGAARKAKRHCAKKRRGATKPRCAGKHRGKRRAHKARGNNDIRGAK
jgi:hypothetical protein